MASTDWLLAAREIKRKVVKSESTECLCQPIFKGKTLRLEYRDLKLRISDLDEKTIAILKKSGVPRFLHNETYANWGGSRPPILYVHGLLVRSRKDETIRRFVATYVCGKDGVEYHNQITSMHLLFARGFFTPIAQCSWMHTRDINPIALKRRLAAKEKLRIESKDGKAFSANPPIGLQLFDCMAWNLKLKKPKTVKRKST